MGGMDLSAETAERYGYINRALPPDELGPFVEKLAYRIASYSSDAIALNKQSVLNAEEMPLADGLLEESYLFGQLASQADAKRRMNRVLELGAQTYQGELDFDQLVARMDQGSKDE